jgi:hypothetical protein
VRNRLPFRIAPSAGHSPGAGGVRSTLSPRASNDPNVELSLVWPEFAVRALVANDGGFRVAGTFPVAGKVRWKLDSSGPERLPKTVYLRYDGSAQTLQDDIILDQTPPTIATAQLASPAAATKARASAAKRKKTKLYTYKVKLKAKDATSGVASVQLATVTTKPFAVQRYKAAVTLRAKTAPRYVRVRDRAGNFTKWKKLTQPKKATNGKKRAR